MKHAKYSLITYFELESIFTFLMPFFAGTIWILILFVIFKSGLQNQYRAAVEIAIRLLLNA